jgi:glycosyltransferase involved in cell wall biosynthesis
VKEPDPLISLIIPVYNVRDFINQCLESVLAQDYKNIEVIIINDKSPDDSMELAKENIEGLKNKYHTLVIEHEKNRGLSGARNSGLLQAKGRYVLFLDSDDELEEQAVSCLVRGIEETQENVDVVIGNFTAYDGSKRSALAKKIYQSNYDIFYSFLKKQWYVMAWNKLISREFLSRNNIWFEEGLLHEDTLFSYELAFHAESMAFCGENTYKYRIKRQGSITSKYTCRNFENLIYITGKKIALFNKTYLQKEFFEYIVGYCYYLVLLLYQNDIIEKNKVIAEIKGLLYSLPMRTSSNITVFLKYRLMKAPLFVIKPVMAFMYKTKKAQGL